MSSARHLFPVLMIAVLLVACGSGNDQAKVSAAQAVTPIDETGFDKLVTQRNGKILVLNIWATWCIPCQEEFPDLVRLAGYYKDKDVEVIGLSADYPDEIDTKIKPFLRQFNVPFSIYVKDVKDDEAFINKLNPDWGGGLPATIIYNRDGKRQDFILGKRDFEFFKSRVEPLRGG